MIVWTIPDKATIELDEEGWWVKILGKKYLQFNTLSECLCYLAGRGVIKYKHIEMLIRATRKRME